MKYLPLFVDLAGRECLVVGGGKTATRKLHLLLRTDAQPTVIAASVTPEINALEEDGRVRIEKGVRGARTLLPDRLTAYALIVVADADSDKAETIAAAAQHANVPVNVVDRPDLSTVVFPGIVDRDPVLVAIGSSGAAPVLVRRLREQIEAMLPSRLGNLARFAQRFRSAVASAQPDSNRRRRLWEAFFDGPIARLVLDGREDQATNAMLRRINKTGRTSPEGTVALVGVGPGDPDLLTLRAMRAMQDADVVVYDRLISDQILDYVRRDAERIFVGKTKGRHPVPQEEINRTLIDRAHAGKRVVRLKGGDPFVFGRGGEEMIDLQDAGIAVEIVPGITAATGCAAAAALPLTHRDYASGVTLVTGHLREGSEEPDWAHLAGTRDTLVFYMGVSNARAIGEQLVAHGMRPATPIALIENGTRPEQVVARGTLSNLGATVAWHSIVGPALIVIGEVAALATESTQDTETRAQAYALAL
jgi:uroporphyrin-III C-methyltransferase/precorrin-2 dehydrogenase/sirohydrochlorin ferrochelatase